MPEKKPRQARGSTGKQAHAVEQADVQDAGYLPAPSCEPCPASKQHAQRPDIPARCEPQNPQRAFVRECILTALLALMKSRPYESITISDITAKAGVSRMAYYRNYTSKDEILTSHLDELFEGYLQGLVQIEDVSTRDLATGFCDCFYANRAFIATMVKGDVAGLILQQFELYLDTLYKSMINEKIHHAATRYERAYNAGGLYLALIEWARNDFAESPEQMARLITDLSRQI